MEEQHQKFEELDDALADWADLGEIIQESKDCSFQTIYSPIRAFFAADSSQWEKFGQLKSHKERIQFLTRMKVVQNSLVDIVPTSEKVHEEPKPTIERKRQRKEPPQLSHGANKMYPNLSKALEVKRTSAEGRHMIAKQKILPGEVLIVEQAQTTSLFRDFYPTHCANCFRRVEEEELVNCISCKTVKFCSETCLRNSWPVHKYECRILDYIDSKDIGHMATLAFRIVAAQEFSFIVENVEKFDEMEPSYEDGDYISAYKQESNMALRPSGDHLKRCVTALILARLVKVLYFHGFSILLELCNGIVH